MVITVTDALMIALASGAASGLITWGGVRVELRWLRRDVEEHARRLARLESALIGRRAGDLVAGGRVEP